MITLQLASHYGMEGKIMDVPIDFSGGVALRFEDIMINVFMDFKDLQGDELSFDSFNLAIVIGNAYLVIVNEKGDDVEVDVKPIVEAVRFL